MKKIVLTSFFVASVLGFSLESLAQNSNSFRLITNHRTDRVSFTVRGAKKRCVTTIYGSNTSAGLAFDRTRAKIVGLKPARSNFSVNFRINKSNRKGGNAYFQAITMCSGKTYKSNKSTVRLTKNSNSPTRNVRSYLLSLRSVSLKTRTRILPKFNKTAFNIPVDLQNHSSSRELYVVEQTGKILKLFPDGSSATVLDITSFVSTGGEKGLLGLAFHPNFNTNGYIFVNYTRTSDSATIISRFTVNSNSGTSDPGTEKQLLVVPQPYSNHNGGALAFGPDGFLYIALGDGGSGGDPLGNGQSLTTLLGKILRIDINTDSLAYNIPASNPFAGNTQGYKEEIYAYGLRNPWRISFDGNNLWAADVGQGKLEEVNLIKSGGNYGWNILEGTQCYLEENCSSAGFVKPINEYNRSLGSSITGGYVSRRNNSPNINGSYIFGDFISGRIFALEKLFGRWHRTQIRDTDLYISSFGKGRNGEVYLVSYSDGNIHMIQ